MHLGLLKVHLTPKKLFFVIIIKLILWSKLAQTFLDLVKSSSFYAPSKPSFEWFETAHRESGERQSCDVKSRTNASPVRSSILHRCGSDFAAQVFLLGLHSQQIYLVSIILTMKRRKKRNICWFFVRSIHDNFISFINSHATRDKKHVIDSLLYTTV